MVALCNRADHYIFILFLLSSLFLFFPRLISAVADWMSTYFYTRCGPSANLECRSEMCCTRLTGNAARKKSPKIGHLGTIAQLCRVIIFATKARIDNRIKSLLHSNICSTCPHNMVNVGPLTATAEICWQVCGTPANFSGFRVLAALLVIYCTALW